MSPLIRHPKKRGEWVELQFMARAAAHGLTVSKPWGDCARYDFAVEHDGVFQRVQVKSVSYFTGHRYQCNTVFSGLKGQNARHYTRDQVDFFAIYIVPEDLWYVIPMSAFGQISRSIYLNPRQSTNKYFRYMEAWHLLGGCATQGVHCSTAAT